MTVVAADIGGTFSRFTWSNGESSTSSQLQKLVFENRLFSGFNQVLAQFIKDAALQNQRLQSLVLALPAPITSNKVRLTNIDWVIDSAEIQQQHPFKRVELINDFQAAAVGSITTPTQNLIALTNHHPNPDAPAVVAGAGTGLGLAWLDNHHLKVLPHGTEGGHVDYAPNSALEADLYRELSANFGHVSYERLLSGSGLVNIYRFLTSQPELEIEPVTLLQRAQSQEDVAIHSIELFFDIFAAFAGNLALLFNPGGGIYLCGGMTVRLLPWLNHERFIHGYLSKGRMDHVVNKIPLFFVSDDGFGLRGAMKIAHNLATD